MFAKSISLGVAVLILISIVLCVTLPSQEVSVEMSPRKNVTFTADATLGFHPSQNAAAIMIVFTLAWLVMAVAVKVVGKRE